MENLNITLIIGEEHKRDIPFGYYDHSNPRKELPAGVREAKFSDLRDSNGPKLGTPIIFQHPHGGSYYATRINKYGIDGDMVTGVMFGHVWVLNEDK